MDGFAGLRSSKAEIRLTRHDRPLIILTGFDAILAVCPPPQALLSGVGPIVNLIVNRLSIGLLLLSSLHGANWRFAMRTVNRYSVC